jgi:ADP-heptose:LPS heptosyltransferase
VPVRRNVVALTRDYRPPLLALRALGLGDFLTGIPALRGLRRAYPEYRTVLACPDWLHPLVRAADAVDDAVTVAGLAAFHCRLPPALAVNLHGRGPQSHRVLLAQRPIDFVAFAHPDIPETEGMPEWRRREHEVARWCRLLTEAGIPCDPTELALDAARFATRAPLDAIDATVIHPGAASPARRWPATRFAAVARAEKARGRRVVVTGGRGDVARCARIAALAGLPSSAVVAGRTSLVDLASIVAVAGRVVCGDTGVAHLATALGRPSVVLFGPVPPDEWGPPPSRAMHRALWAGRRGDPHAETAHDGLLEITTRDVLRALDSLLCSNASAPFAQRSAG